MYILRSDHTYTCRSRRCQGATRTHSAHEGDLYCDYCGERLDDAAIPDPATSDDPALRDVQELASQLLEDGEAETPDEALAMAQDFIRNLDLRETDAGLLAVPRTVMHAVVEPHPTGVVITRDVGCGLWISWLELPAIVAALRSELEWRNVAQGDLPTALAA